MTKETFCILGIIVAAVISIWALSPIAKSQPQIAPAYVSIGASSSGNTSTAWFHQLATGAVLACQTTTSGANLSGIHCVSTKLPTQ